MLSLIVSSDKIEELKNRAIIWGQVQVGGKPVRGAKVELAGENIAPIYFNNYFLPDPKLNETSENGLFVYVGMAGGLYQVRSQIAEKYIDGIVVPAVEKTVSPVTLQVAEKIKEVDVRLADVRSQENVLSGTLRRLGLEEVVEVIANTKSAIPLLPRVNFVEGESHDYYPTRMTQRKNEDTVLLPLVSKSWQAEIFNIAKKSYDINLGAILLMVDQDLAQIYLNQELLPETNAIYLSKKAEIVNKENWKEGMLFLYNLPTGLNTLMVLKKNQAAPYIQLAITDPELTSVVDLTTSKKP